jgi:hypothetical protein
MTELELERLNNFVQFALADEINQPAHYTDGGIETIDFIEAKKLGYNLGNVVKYISRAGKKGNRLQDLQKAQWYLAREIKNEVGIDG